MPESRRLLHPPITEAIIDFRADLGVGFDVSRLREAEDLLSGRYLLVNEQLLFSRTIPLMGDAPPAAVDNGDPVLIGYTFRSPDERFVAQLTVEGLTLSQLHGYTRWEDLEEEAAHLWDVYSRVAAPKTVLRMGTRFLNAVQVPRSAASLDEYFTTVPRVPAGVSQTAASFLVRLLLHEEESPYSVSITQYIETPDDSSRMILDIDAFSRETYEPDASMMWEALGGLRELKNRVFFGSLTEKALGLFE